MPWTNSGRFGLTVNYSTPLCPFPFDAIQNDRTGRRWGLAVGEHAGIFSGEEGRIAETTVKGGSSGGTSRYPDLALASPGGCLALRYLPSGEPRASTTPRLPLRATLWPLFPLGRGLQAPMRGIRDLCNSTPGSSIRALGHRRTRT
jgi:hypothetical protein